MRNLFQITNKKQNHKIYLHFYLSRNSVHFNFFLSSWNFKRHNQIRRIKMRRLNLKTFIDAFVENSFKKKVLMYCFKTPRLYP